MSYRRRRRGHDEAAAVVAPHCNRFGLIRELSAIGTPTWRSAISADEYTNYAYDDYLPPPENDEPESVALFYDRLNRLYPLPDHMQLAYWRCRKAEFQPELCRLALETTVSHGLRKPYDTIPGQMTFYSVQHQLASWYDFGEYHWEDVLDNAGDVDYTTLGQLASSGGFRVPDRYTTQQDFCRADGSPAWRFSVKLAPEREPVVPGSLLTTYTEKNNSWYTPKGPRNFVISGLRATRPHNGRTPWDRVTFFKDNLANFVSSLHGDCRSVVGHMRYLESNGSTRINWYVAELRRLLELHQFLFGVNVYRRREAYKTLIMTFNKALEPNLQFWRHHSPCFLGWIEQEWDSRQARLVRNGKWAAEKGTPSLPSARLPGNHYESKLLPKLVWRRKQLAAKQKRAEQRSQAALKRGLHKLTKELRDGDTRGTIPAGDADRSTGAQLLGGAPGPEQGVAGPEPAKTAPGELAAVGAVGAV